MMRRVTGRLPSPAMTLAFVALVAALTGTAVALPGSNTVTSGDITNGAVKTQDIRNSTVRGRDVRNNSLTGRDVRESSLGTVPRAGTAGAVGAANTAGAAAFAGTAGTAGSTAGLFRSGQARAADEQTVPIVTIAGWRLSLRCDLDGSDTISGSAGEIVLTNVSAGDDAHMDADNIDDSDLDEGEEAFIVGENGDDTQRNWFTAVGANGTITGDVTLNVAPDDAFDVADCLGHVFVGTS